MNSLIVGVFPDSLKAEQVRLDLLKMQRDRLIDLDEVVVAVRETTGKIVLHHATHLTLPCALAGGFLGTLAGVILLNPVFAVLGLAAGTVLGGVSCSLADIGADDKFVEDLAEHLKPGSSALFALVKDEATDRVVEELRKSGGRVFQTSLSHTDPTKLQSALDEVPRNLDTQGHSKVEEENKDEKMDVNRTDCTCGGTADLRYHLRATHGSRNDGSGRWGTTTIWCPAARLVLSI